MKKLHTFVIPCLLVSGAALADHNSIWGEGWANMPNDMHNLRIETLGDNDAFLDSMEAGSMASEDLLSTLDIETSRGVGGGAGAMIRGAGRTR